MPFLRKKLDSKQKTVGNLLSIKNDMYTNSSKSCESFCKNMNAQPVQIKSAETNQSKILTKNSNNLFLYSNLCPQVLRLCCENIFKIVCIELVNTVSKIVKIFRNFESIKNIKESQPADENSSFSFKVISEKEVKNTIQDLPIKKSSISGDIPTKIIKQHAQI